MVLKSFRLTSTTTRASLEVMDPCDSEPRPDILFCASMWTPEEQTEIQRIAKNTIPCIKTYAIPTGMHVKAGPEGIIKYLTERIDSIVNGE
ncbi:hypothetical protein L198_08113 [Cryptococcus wingfieldii CBS 7118]|uniref:Uncharacterized protein n=1 Tax=Cryptococcus wingfieldii CBS 7118 TaxID=1295528 RepID=A0A1E3HIZ9_9TREE|nr:hypothetical protein L198_08113 [Cryptococcus wingfieldii CBS 7118]ODN76337.1 hypothetical protein L198_08113 [Cryptococcus wingfieldii CBS 7118]